MSDPSGSYNAVTWLLDRNIDEGRAKKLAFTDTVSELTYGDLQKQSRRVANMLRRLGVRPRRARGDDHARYDRFSGGVFGRDPRRHRAGAAQYASDLGSYAYVLADCRARVLFISQALLPVVKDMLGRMPDLDHVVVSGNDAQGYKKLSDELAGESDAFVTAATHADEPAFWLYSSGSTGMPKGVRASAFQSRRNRGHLCQAGCLAFARKMFVSRRQNCFSLMASAMR